MREGPITVPATTPINSAFEAYGCRIFSRKREHRLRVANGLWWNNPDRLSHLEGLKARWRVSMQAIAHRCKNTGIIDEHQYILFRKQISFRRWQKTEPLDDTIPLEQTEWLLKCWKLLTDKKIVREVGLEDELGFSLDLVVRLFGHSEIHGRPLSHVPKRTVPLG